MTSRRLSLFRQITAAGFATLVISGCSSSTGPDDGSGGNGGSGAVRVFRVTYSGSGHWEDVTPKAGGAPAATANATVVWQLVYKVDFDNRSVELVSRDVTGSGAAAYWDQDASGNPIVCSGPIVPDPTQLAYPSLDLAQPGFPADRNGSASFYVEAMGGSAFHLCDRAIATGIHQLFGYNVSTQAHVTIQLADWLTAPAPQTTVLPVVDSHQTMALGTDLTETLDIHWEGTVTVAKY